MIKMNHNTTQLNAFSPGVNSENHLTAIQCVDVCKSYGGIKALDQVSLSISSGEVLGIVGANGAGKTTLLNVLTGVMKIDSGTINILDQRMDYVKPGLFARVGVARTFQKVRLFEKLSVLENIRVAIPAAKRWSIWSALLWSKQERTASIRDHECSERFLSLIGLASRGLDRVQSLTYGERRLVEIARALARQPRILILDEPAAGMSELEVDHLAGVLQQLCREKGLTLIIIEHRWSLLESCAHRVIWMKEGRIVQDGSPETIFAGIMKQTRKIS